MALWQDQAREELRWLGQFESPHQENLHLLERIRELESLLEEMATSNQEVIKETSDRSEDFKLQVESLEQQMRADKRFMTEQAMEREGEREEFTRKLEHLQDVIKRKEKEEDAKISLLSKKVRVKISIYE